MFPLKPSKDVVYNIYSFTYFSLFLPFSLSLSHTYTYRMQAHSGARTESQAIGMGTKPQRRKYALPSVARSEIMWKNKGKYN